MFFSRWVLDKTRLFAWVLCDVAHCNSYCYLVLHRCISVLFIDLSLFASLLLVRRLAVAFYIIFSCAPLKPDYAMRLRIVSFYESVQAIMSSKHCTLYMIRLNAVSPLSRTFNLLVFLIPAHISSY